MEIEKYLINKIDDDNTYQLLITNVPNSHKKRFWLKKYDKNFIELYCIRTKYSSFRKGNMNDCYELKDIKQNKEYTLYVTNTNYLLAELMSHTFLKEDKINEDILYKEIFETLPSNVYHIYRLLNDINNSNIYYLYGCKKYNNTFKGDDSYIFLKYDLNNNTKQQYKVIHQSLCLDGGTTDLRLMDDKEQMHYYHWDSKLKKAEDRHNVFDDITLIDVSLTEEIIEKFNKVNDNIILEYQK